MSSAPAIKELSSAERLQREPDRFLSSPESSVQTGRLYEQYIGYLHGRTGYAVEYHGTDRGPDNPGCSLVCRKDGHAWVIQCRRWQRKTVSVKYIYQLAGTTYQYAQEHPGEAVYCAFFATTRFSLQARNAAKKLHITLHENDYPLPERFPLVKCYTDASGGRFYILPVDAGYYAVGLNLKRGISTVRRLPGLRRRDFVMPVNQYNSASFRA